MGGRSLRSRRGGGIMGLDCSHNAFSGAYSAFNRFRQAVAKAAGGSSPPHEDKALDPGWWYIDDQYTQKTHPGLFAFMNHSDCDGEIFPAMCINVADDLEELLPEIAKQGTGGGHLERDGGLEAVAKRFIEGCRKAAEAGEDLLFR